MISAAPAAGQRRLRHQVLGVAAGTAGFGAERPSVEATSAAFAADTADGEAGGTVAAAGGGVLDESLDSVMTALRWR